MSLNLKAEDFDGAFDPNNYVERISANIVGGGTKGISYMNIITHFFEKAILKMCFNEGLIYFILGNLRYLYEYFGHEVFRNTENLYM